MTHINTREAGELASETSYSGQTQDHSTQDKIVHLEHFCHGMLVTAIFTTAMVPENLVMLQLLHRIKGLENRVFGIFIFKFKLSSRLTRRELSKDREDLEDSDMEYPPQVVSTIDP